MELDPGGSSSTHIEQIGAPRGPMRVELDPAGSSSIHIEQIGAPEAQYEWNLTQLGQVPLILGLVELIPSALHRWVSI